MLHPDTARRVRDASQSASRASIALTLTGLVHALHAGVLTSLAFFLRALDRDELMSDAVARRIDDLSQGTATAALVAMFVCAAAFLQWLYRFVTASARLAPEGARLPSPGAAVFAFFVPVMNLYAPLRDLRALHAALDVTELPEAPPKPRAEGAHYRENAAERDTPIATPAAPLGLWWGVWIASDVLINLATFVSLTRSALQGALVGLVGDLASVGAAVLGVSVVRRLDARLRERHRRLVASEEAPSA